ncbi:MAG: ImmA/IrrE family metallo-endopeptidase [Pseudonocardiaceae bacterium]
MDIIGLIQAARVEVFGEHGKKLFGTTIFGEDHRPAAIWLNAGSTVIGQRHTAAHEWGHYILGHTATCEITIGAPDPATIDGGTTADRDAMAARTLPETTAEAFAAWLLMPRAALAATLRALRVTGTPSPRQCYVLSLVLGTSYRGTARQLRTARLIDQTASDFLMRIAPGRIKRALDCSGVPVPDPRANIWRLSDFGGCTDLVLAHGDRVIADQAELDIADALLENGLAETIAESSMTRVLSATAPSHHNRSRSTLRIPRPVGDLTVRVDQVIRGVADPSAVLDVSTMTEDEIDEHFRLQEQLFRASRGHLT